VPALQLVQEGWLVLGLYVPVAQLRQALAEVEPVVGLYVPALHPVQAGWPDRSL